ISK
ncbi:hypothetical protein EC951288_3189, partial [Escherichia coli 95.1288]